VPDAPVSKFVLRMPAGHKSLLENSRNICRNTQRATVEMEAHNGKLQSLRPQLRVACGKKRRGGGDHRR
ncbi:MAG TPA: hypothetical protein VKA35_01270, partial [Solirubrobacterales bacterium]|nr:hypothetical protein [Solirubrobacterales bacterium]